MEIINNEEKKYNQSKNKIFEVSKFMQKLFEDAMNCTDYTKKVKTIHAIEKLQKKCYKYVNSRKLNDNVHGSHCCYPGGSVDVYRPNTHKQNVVDMIDYFFINKGFSSANDFIENSCEKLHIQESGYSTGYNEYHIETTPKRFYDASCWKNFVLNNGISYDILDINKDLSQSKIDEINKNYAQDENLEANYM